MMEVQIYTNHYSNIAQKNLARASDDMSKAVGRLSSGIRINHASDDAAGIAMADKLRGQVNGLAKAAMNAQDAISLLQSAEGGMETMSDILQRMRELAVQAGNGTYTSSDRQQLQKEVEQLKLEIDRISVSAEYNAKKLLTGESSSLWSTTSVDLEAVIKGVVAEGNYRLDFNVEPGHNAVYKSSIMTKNINDVNGILNYYRENGLAGYIPDIGGGVEFISGNAQLKIADDGLGSLIFGAHDPLNDYDNDHMLGKITTNPALASIGTQVSGDGGYLSGYFSDANGNSAHQNLISSTDFTITVSAGASNNFYSIVLESDWAVSATPYVYATLYDQNNEIVSSVTVQHSDLVTGTTIDFGDIKFGSVAVGTDFIDELLYAISEDSKKAVFNYIPSGLASDLSNVTMVTLEHDATWTGNFVPEQLFGIATVDGDTVTMNGMKVVNGELQTYSLSATNKNGAPANVTDLNMDIVSPQFTKGRDVSMRDIMLKDLDVFTNADGRMVLDNTQTLTIYGNNKHTEIFLEGTDSIQTFMDKLSKALIDGLDMGAAGVYASELVQLVTANSTSGDFSVFGTMVLQSALNGKNSDISFTGDEAVLNALGWKQMHASSESDITVSVYEAHHGALVGSDTVTDQMIRGIIEGVDIKYNKAVGISASFDSNTGQMIFSSKGLEDAYLHVVDNRSTIQVGANEGMTINIAVARLDLTTMELNDVNVVTQAGAAKSLIQIDQAFEKVVHARATVGAQVSRIENTLKNISISRENMIRSESRIRDLDVAEESANFARVQLLTNAAVSILAQANQLPQTALQLIAGR